MTHAHSISEQANWEVASVARGVARYREYAAGKQAYELSSGRAVLVETVGAVSAGLSSRLDEEAGRVVGKPPPWGPVLLAFDPEVLAVITVSVAMRYGPSVIAARHLTIPRFSNLVCSALRDQLDHDAFVSEQAAAAKAQGRGNHPEPADKLLRRFRRMNPSANGRAWRRFAERIERSKAEEWPEAMCFQIGAVLADSLAAAVPKWFTLEQAGDGPKNRRPMCLTMTPWALDRMTDCEVRAEVARPLLLPMLCPPNDWRYAEKTPKEPTH